MCRLVHFLQIVKEDNFGLPPEGEEVLHAALRALPHLEQLVLDVMGPPATALPSGPWCRTLKRLAAPAHILKNNLSVLGELSCLEALGMDWAYGEPEGQHTAALSVLRWAAEQQALPWRRLAMQLDARPTAEIFNTSQAVKSRHQHIEIALLPDMPCAALIGAAAD